MLYIVHIAVQNERTEEWFRWMRDIHVPEVLETGCFSDATVVRDPEADDETHTCFRILYRAHSERAFHRYQEAFAPALQADHEARFGGSFRGRREVLPIVSRTVPLVELSEDPEGAG